MRLKYTKHAILESMPDEKITTEEVVEAIRKSSLTTRLSSKKYKFHYRGLEVVAQKEKGYWLVITCYRT
jgi:hypothetical protein